MLESTRIQISKPKVSRVHEPDNSHAQNTHTHSLSPKIKPPLNYPPRSHMHGLTLALIISHAHANRPLSLSFSKFKSIEPSVLGRTLSYMWRSDDDGIDDGMMTRLKTIPFLSSVGHPSI